jgi:hypothetical protein
MARRSYLIILAAILSLTDFFFYNSENTSPPDIYSVIMYIFVVS